MDRGEYAGGDRPERMADDNGLFIPKCRNEIADVFGEVAGIIAALRRARIAMSAQIDGDVAFAGVQIPRDGRIGPRTVRIAVDEDYGLSGRISPFDIGHSDGVVDLEIMFAGNPVALLRGKGLRMGRNRGCEGNCGCEQRQLFHVILRW